MQIKWNEVTWYSKLLALILFTTFPFIGFLFGVWYSDIQADALKFELQAEINKDHAPRYYNAPISAPTTNSQSKPIDSEVKSKNSDVLLQLFKEGNELKASLYNASPHPIVVSKVSILNTAFYVSYNNKLLMPKEFCSIFEYPPSEWIADQLSVLGSGEKIDIPLGVYLDDGENVELRHIQRTDDCGGYTSYRHTLTDLGNYIVSMTYQYKGEDRGYSNVFREKLESNKINL